MACKCPFLPSCLRTLKAGPQSAETFKIHTCTLSVLRLTPVHYSVTIVCCVRLKFIADSMTSANPTQTLFDITRWSTIEANTSVYCACMPLIRQVLMRLFPHTAGSDNSGMLRFKSYYDRLFASKRTRASQEDGSSSNPDGGSIIKNELPLRGAKGKPGFWTLQLSSASAEGDEEDQQPIYLQGNAETADERANESTNGRHIIHTTGYQVEYGRAARAPQPSNITLTQLDPKPHGYYHAHVSHGM